MTSTNNTAPSTILETAWTDIEAMDDLTAFVNLPGDVNGGDLYDRVALLIEATGRPIIDNADSDCEHDH